MIDFSEYFTKEDFLLKISKIGKNFIIIIFLIIFAAGFMMLYSAGDGNLRPWAFRQLLYFISFSMLALFIATIKISFFVKYANIFYYVGIFLLLLVEIKGYRAMGARRWLNLGIFKLQPSEIMKICMILYLAKYFQITNSKEIKTNKKLIKPVVYYIISAFLILKQPNLGTALILTAIVIGIFFLVGVQLWKFGVIIILTFSLIPIMWSYVIKDYQKQRVLTFLNPEQDSLNSGYNIIQSKIAIGSGGIWGKGFKKGTQGQLEFLPEKHTDFIFTLLSEEFGFIGALFIIVMYFMIFLYCAFLITRCTHTFGRVIVGGIMVNIFCHFFINLGMISGIMPVVGTPLPLMSYGGSITAATMISLGLLLNVDLNRNEDISIA